VGGGFSYGALGISHHATEDLSILSSLPNLTVISPCGYWETTEATEAIVKTEGTFYLRLDKSSGNDMPQDNNERFEIGRARVLREGSDCAVFVTGGISEEVWQAVEVLESQGIGASIISVHTIKPIDKEMLMQICSHIDAIITVEEHTITGGLGGAVAETLMDCGVYPKKFLRIGLEAGFSSIVGSQKYLRQRYGMDAGSIANKIQSLLSRDD
jgi:transketolase